MTHRLNNIGILFVVFTAVSAAAGCALLDSDVAPQPAEPDQDRVLPVLRAGSPLTDAPPCDVETQCDEGTCAYIDLADGTSGAYCVDMGAVCDELDCGDNECLVLESYPVQIVCESSSDPGDGGDEPVCSDGDCPGDGVSSDDSDSSGGTEPGNPGNG